MKNTEKEIQKAFMKLLSSYSIEEIDVKMICDILKIKRQSFYYHYKNIYDVIYSMFREDDIEIKNSGSLEVIIKDLIDYLFKNEDFNREILVSSAKDILEEYAFSYLYRSFILYLAQYRLTIDNQKETARFYGKAVASQLLFYFKNADYTKEEIYLKMNFLFNEQLLKFSIKR
ncbi:MAG: hypothetical protein J6X03_04365 [Bacilli bacterium]|nr:hypothetical protein [Bacilli bacterium]